MAIIRPRLTDYHGIHKCQESLDFAIPFLDEDLPLYVDPFLLWKNHSHQDQALHTSIVNSFNHLAYLVRRGKRTEAEDILIIASECEEVGLGHSGQRKGARIGRAKAREILSVAEDIPEYSKQGYKHFEEIQLFVDGISSDRISDFCCSLVKSFLIDYTIQECDEIGIPREDVEVKYVYNYRDNKYDENERVSLPINPENGLPLIFVPRRWMRFGQWLNFEEYFRDYCPREKIFGKDEPQERAKVLRFNRANYGIVQQYVTYKERQQSDCKNDPLFSQIPIASVRRKVDEVLRLPTGKTEGADRRYEDLMTQLFASMFYPELDFASEQARTESGVLIRDLVFYNNRDVAFLEDIFREYSSSQLVFELKNVAAVDREHINQLNRYMAGSFGKFGVLVTRNPLSQAMMRNTIDLWAGQRRCILAVTDEDLKLMANMFESKSRKPLEVLNKKYHEFQLKCPS